MDDEAWIAEQILEIQRMPYYHGPRLTPDELAIQAPLECAKCPGRKHGCCSHQCQFWPWTATDAERKTVEDAGKLRPEYRTPGRGWLGSEQPAGFDLRELKEAEVA